MANDFSKKVQEFNKKSRKNLTDSHYLSLESVDEQIICLMRLLLAVSALLITFIDPTSPDRLVEITYSILFGYCLYSAILYICALRRRTFVSVHAIPWIDAVWYLALITLSSGTSSIFFFFFFFSIIVAAFRTGFDAGVRVTLVSALVFTLIGYATVEHDREFELNRFLIRPVYLMMFGYLISYWGGREIRFKRRLLLLRDVSRLSNPRFGADRTLSNILNRLRAFYEVDSCVLITLDSSATFYTWREASRDKPDENLKIEQTEAAAPLIKLPGELAIAYRLDSKFRFFGSTCQSFNTMGEETGAAKDTCLALADLLAAKSFLTVPIFRRGTIFGRLYLTSRHNFFERSDVEFISYLTEQIFRAVENVELLNRLASGAAERQRQKISRDLHDSTIQPYIGLKLGLEAIEIKHAAGAPIEKDIEKLIKLTEQTVAELRGYVSSLKNQTGEVEGEVLIMAIRQQALKYQEFYGIKINVRAADGFQINDRLAAEAFQIVSEGLSNIKRHTKARQGTIGVYRDEEKLFLEIENENSEPDATTNFTPKSIAGRAESLGGAARVERAENRTKVIVEIPL